MAKEAMDLSVEGPADQGPAPMGPVGAVVVGLYV